ncbi:MAG: molybdopterin-dependent oxidoreductase [Vicinamibacterales bacterium]
MDRRSFIKLTAVTGTSATLAACGSPENQLIRFVPDDPINPGLATYKPGVCPLCATGCGLTVRVMDADVDTVRDGQAGVVTLAVAKKLDGTPAHPVNRGGLCARGQAAIQVTYHPDRITQPLKRSGERGTATYEAITWDAAIAELTAQLDQLAAAGNQQMLAALVRPGLSHRRVLMDRFLGAYGAPAALSFEIFSDDVLRRANAMSFGREQLPTYDLGRANFVLGFGADFLGSWNAPVAHAAGYGEMRQGRPGQRGGFVQVESRMSQTGASADEWVAIRPGTDGALALGIAHVIMAENLRPAAGAGRAGSLIEGWGGGLADYTPDAVERITGVPARRIEELAHEFAGRQPAVAIVGGAPLGHTNGLFTALAVNALNALVGTVGQPGGIFFTPQLLTPVATVASGFRLQAEGPGTSIGDAQILFVDGANPVYAAPRAWNVRDAIARVPYIVSFGSFLDETSALADLILPDSTFLESWTDATPESGSLVAVASLAPPAMRALYQTRPTGDVLLDLGRRVATPLNLPWQTFDEMLRATIEPLPAPSADTDAWTAAQTQGGWWGDLPAGRDAQPAAAAAAGAPAAYAAPAFAGNAEQYPFHFLPYASTQFGDGTTAHLPWLQEMPDPVTSAMWSSWVEINPATAARLGIGQGDIVELASPQGRLQTAAMITPGIAPDLLAMPAGQGHTTFTRYASGRGENPIDLLAATTEPATGAVAWAATRVSIARIGDPDGRLVMFAGGLREHEPNEGLGRG